MIEHFFTCPHCLQKISMLMDPSIPEQQYVEDCEVCCNPLQIYVQFEGDEIVGFDAQPAQ